MILINFFAKAILLTKCPEFIQQEVQRYRKQQTEYRRQILRAAEVLHEDVEQGRSREHGGTIGKIGSDQRPPPGGAALEYIAMIPVKGIEYADDPGKEIRNQIVHPEPKKQIVAAKPDGSIRNAYDTELQELNDAIHWFLMAAIT